MDNLDTNKLSESISRLILETKKILESSLYGFEKPNMGLNVFQMISDTYYRENFHSDIISELLLIKSEKGEQENLKLFIECLKLRKPELSLDWDNFTTNNVFREDGRIDILIIDNLSKRAIIIENKINNAVDQYRQIPRYWEIVLEKKLIPVCVVYLTLDTTKPISTYNWTEEENNLILNSLIYLPAYEFNTANLCDNWLDRCILNSDNIDLTSILRQYKNLIKYLKIQYMNTELLEKFYNLLNDDKDFKAAIKIKDMLDEMCQYRAVRIYNTFNDQARPIFDSISHFQYEKDYRAKFENPKNSENFSFWIDVVCLADKSTIKIVENNYDDKKDTYVEGMDKVRWLIDKLQLETIFVQDQNYKRYYFADFQYPSEEKKLYDTIGAILDKLPKIEKYK